ncbi:hypothetical protein FHW83_004241 [Duganella sp. SG902]|uniref:contractile injection system tape measure protein n=1 Tax=Duganella sp. SG902 TaxID=2587016 RepID=UPI00159E23F3|nr:contractile injection system tape measure protein [Duganella sp. SG902]NVM78413.1 hypothetical protein [Duganella sp. SG902]
MSIPVHQLGQVNLDFSSATMATALRWRGWIEEFARVRLPAVLATVFDQLAPPDLHVRIRRLDLDLGEIAAEALDSELPAALEQALRAALEAALARATHAPSAQAIALSPAAAALDEFGVYLASGAVPARSASNRFAPAAVLRQLIADQPAALVALLRRHAGDRYVIERLALQSGAEGLHDLLKLLSPAHAAVILAYLADFRRLHPLSVATPAAAPALQRALWVLTLTYLLHEAGTQFNRRSYLAALITAVAASEGLGYAALLAQMHAAALKTRASQPLAGTLLSVLDELVAAVPAATAPAATAAGDDPVARAEAGDVESLLRLLRRGASQPVALDALLRVIPEPVFTRVIERLQPVHATLIVSYIRDLGALHRQRPLPSLSASGFEHQLRLLALRYLLRDPGSEFNRLSWLRRLLTSLAMEAGVSYRHLLLSFADVLAGLRARMPLSSSLPEGLAVLTAELASRHPGDTAPARQDRPDATSTLLERLRGQAGHPAALAAMLRACPPAQFTDLLNRLAPAHGAAIHADIAALIRSPLWRRPGAAAMATRIAPIALQLLLAAGPPFERQRWRQQLLDRLAQEAALPPAELVVAWTAPDVPAAVVDPQAAVALAERFLRTGQPPAMGARLSDLAAANPGGFAALLRRLLPAVSDQSGLLLDRILDWMLPEEIAAALVPGQAAQAARWAEMLADEPGADMRSAWGQVLAAALRGDVAGGPPGFAPPQQRLDRLSASRHWLAHGALPWWLPPEIKLDELLSDLPRLSQAQLHGLFFDRSPAFITAALQRVLSHLPAAAGAALLARLAPWASSPGGALAGMQAGLDSTTLRTLQLRAATAAIAGATLDLAQLAAAAPAPAAPVAAAGAAPPPTIAPPASLAWLAGDPAATGEPDDPAFRWLADMLSQPTPELDAALRAGLARPATRARWARLLPEHILALLVYRIAPARARTMLDLKTVLQAAWRLSAPHAARGDNDNRLAAILLTSLAGEPLPAPRALAGRMLASLADGKPAGATLLANAQSLARQGGYANVAALLRPAAPTPVAAAPSPGRAPQPPLADGVPLYVANAGLVLIHPFLQHFLRQLDLLSADEHGVERIRDVDARSRAVHLLQYLVDGRCDRAEPGLALNKLLCGIPLEAPIAAAIEPTGAELALCEQLLAAVIGNWPTMASTSLAALRETFLQREGRLQLKDDKWTLTVSRKTVDVLVDQINWSLSVIVYPWMPAPMAVLW